MKNKILHLLKESKNSFLSGQNISNELGVSRTAIWKYINCLKEEGYKIESVSKKGYKLISSPDLLNAEEIKPYLKTRYLGKNLFYFESVGSTNSTAKELAIENVSDGTVIISEEQTEGRGRLGRNWLSTKYKGIWMSILLRPDMEPMNVPKITQIAAAAVIKACENIKVKALIKWPNDIILNNKKICGILTEMSGELNKVNYVIVGIGVNANIEKEDFPLELLSKASSIICESKIKVNRKSFAADILNNFEELYDELINKESIESSIKICRENSILIGKDIKIISRNKETSCRAVDLDEAGHLVVKLKDGSIEKITSGEISVRGTDGSYTPL